jgi:leucyl aminopeptidase
LPEEYRPLVVSKIADVRNTATSRWGGAITAALFLENFVDKTPWAHLDIAGPASMSASPLPYYGYGATGYGVRMLIHYLKGQIS